MPKNPHADFTPTLAGYSGITPFRFWCQTALPLTYDDSLSYYELLNKVVNYLNNTITDLTNVENNTSELADAYVQLQNYVNDYFDDIDIEAELRNVLDGMAEDGTLDALLNPLVENQLPGVVDEKIGSVVAEQIDSAVAGQIDESVADQLPALVDAGIPEEVSGWLTENVDPVGSAVMVDSSLTISGAAADAKVTGDEVSGLKTQLNNILVKNILSPTWSQGKISNTGSNSDSSSTVSIRTAGKQINSGAAVIEAEEGYTFKWFIYSAPSNDSLVERSLNWESNAVLYFEPGYYLRVMAQKNNGSDEINHETDSVNIKLYEAVFTDTTLTQHNKAADAYTVGTILTNISNKPALANTTTEIAWNVFGTTEHPLGWQRGSYRSSDGSYSTSNNYMCTVNAQELNYDSVKVTPPTGKYIYAYCWDANDAFVERVGTGTIDSVLSFVPTEGYKYQFTIGEFEQQAESYITPEYISTILGYGYSDAFTTLSGKVTKNTTDIGSLNSEIQKINDTPLKASAGLSMYSSLGVCGASWDSGYIYPVGSSVIEKASLSWGANVARRNGISSYGCYAKHSVYTRTYITNSDCLPALMADTPRELYILNFGGNDSEQGTGYIGTTADIENFADSFYGNYSYIIAQIKEHSPNALIILSMWYDSTQHSVTRGLYFEAVQNIAEYYNIPYINWSDDDWYGSTDFQLGIRHNHPSAPLLSGIAQCFERLYANCYVKYADYFDTFAGS